jgi:hypothetical protein
MARVLDWDGDYGLIEDCVSWRTRSRLASLMEVVGALIERYEDERVSELDEPSRECG